MRIACINPGSSSLKLSVLDGEQLVFERSIEAQDADSDLSEALSAQPDAVAVRVVHGGPKFITATVVDDTVLDQLEEVSSLAPLQNPPALRALRMVRRLQPSMPLVACFDTAFHATIPDAAAIYPVPAAWTERWGLRRYGFHGLSHAYASRRAIEMVGRPLARVITCHLGAGASICAISEGRSVDTSMGFTPMEGVMMATRSGSVDPGLILWVLRQGLNPDDVESALDRHSGLLGVSGVSSDFRKVMGAAREGNAPAELALDMYVHRLRQRVAAMAASLGGLDGLVFTGGIGENQAWLREETCAGLPFLNLTIDAAANQAPGGDTLISPHHAPVAVLMVRAREDIEMARQTGELMLAGLSSPRAGL